MFPQGFSVKLTVQAEADVSSVAVENVPTGQSFLGLAPPSQL